MKTPWSDLCRGLAPVLAACSLAAAPAAPDTVVTTRRLLELPGPWQLRRLDPGAADAAALTLQAAVPDTNWITVPRMPAQVQEVLLEQELIPDPRLGRNCAKTPWVFTNDWAYATRFATPEGTGAGPVFLRCDGIDTLATLWVNGRKVGECRDMFMRHRFDLRGLLEPAGITNTLLVVFHSPARFVDEIRRQLGERSPVQPFKYLRKSGSDFGSYLGSRPHFLKMGFFRPVQIDIPGEAWLEDVWARPELDAERTGARVRLVATVQGTPATLQWSLASPEGAVVAAGEAPAGAGGLEFQVPKPRLWWPRSHGTPNLYRLTVDLVRGDRFLDRREIPVGFRTIEPVLKDPETGEDRFAFRVNGQLLYLRGACWAPLDTFTHAWDSSRARRLLGLLEHGHMNVLRVWGEGVLPPDTFYDECDRRGILVWQEFMTGWGLRFPLDYPGWLDLVRAEATDHLRLLRNHPSLFLWCGGNEHYLGFPSQNADPKDPLGRELLEEIFPALVREHDPGRFYHPSSPWGGQPTGNDPRLGDWHDYSTLRFQPGATVPLYGSEICQVSPPSLPSLRRFLTEEELWPAGYEFRVDEPGEIAWPPEWEYHTTGSAWQKIGAIEQFCEPRSPAELVRVLGTGHGEYLQRSIERYRRGTPDGGPEGRRRCWGSTVWRLNDPWPMIYMSVIDAYLEPKIAYYYLRRAYDPVLLCFEKTGDHVWVWVVNDSPRPVSGTVTVQRLQFDGKSLGRQSAEVTVAPGEARRCLDTDALGEVPRRTEFYAATLGAHTATTFLASERSLMLPKPHLSVQRRGDTLEVATDVLARQVSLEMVDTTGAVFEDNFFDLLPGTKRTVRVLHPADGRIARITAVRADAVDVAW